MQNPLVNQLSNDIHVATIPAFNDNYIWCIVHRNGNCALVDPGDANVCIEYIEKHKLTLTSILITHHHPDHVGGIDELVERANKQDAPLTIYGPEKEHIPHCSAKLAQGDAITVSGLDFDFSILDVGGHTLGHIAYVNKQAVFCGDALFSAGCGRMFEGTAEQMHSSLQRLALLPDETLVFCAHEYTQANVDFALAVEPLNVDLINFYNEVNEKRFHNIPTVPTTIGVQKRVNPFLRVNEAEVIESAQQYASQTSGDPVQVFATIRQWKDNF